MRRVILFILIFYFFIPFLYSKDNEFSFQDNKKKKVFAHYVQWFKNRLERKKVIYDHWQFTGEKIKHNPVKIKENGLRDISSVYTPIIGPYDSLDDDVIEYHILTAKSAGIDGFFIDWYGPNNSIDENLQKLFKIALKYNFKIGVCYEEKITFPIYQNPNSREEALKLAYDNFSYINDTYCKYDNYVKFNDKHLVLMFLGHGNWQGFGLKSFNREELIELIKFVNKKNISFVREHLLNGIIELKAGFAWVGDEGYLDWFYKTAKSKKDKGELELVIGSVNPGFNDTGVWGWGNGPRVTPRSNGGLYDKYWQRVLKNDTDMIQIVTWNDFEEGTVIEPTYEDRFLYLDKTEEYISKYKKCQKNLKDNKFAFKLFQLRKYMNKIEETKKNDIRKKTDEIADNFFKYSTDELLLKLDGLSKEIGCDFLNYYEAEDEYDVFPNIKNEERMIKLFLNPENYALKKKVEASYDQDGAPNKAVDGDICTRWASAFKNEQWYIVDLKEIRKVGCIIIDWEAAYGKEYLIEGSTNKEEWKELSHQKEGKGGLKIIEFKETDCRYIRFKGIERGTGWGYSFWEIGVYKKNPEK